MYNTRNTLRVYADKCMFNIFLAIVSNEYKITKENKSWRPYYSQNGKISIEKSPNENIFTMLNKDKTDKSIKIEIEPDLTANTGIQLSNPSLNLNYTQKIEDYK